MARRCLLVLAFVWGACRAAPLSAQLAPENVLVVVNAQSRESMEIGAHYARARRIPEENVVRVYPGVRPGGGWEHFDHAVHGPVLDRMRERGIQDRIRMIVLTRGLPYQVEGEAATWMFYAHGPRSATLNPAFLKRVPFDGISVFGRGNYPAMMLTAFTKEETLALIDRGAASDGLHPPGTVYFLRGSGVRGKRYTQFPQIAAELALMGVRAELTPGAGIEGKPDVLGYMTGATGVPTANDYRPGAFAEHMTSFGGQIYNRNDQMSILEFVAAGVTGTCGTVAEPTADLRKFPHAGFYVLYARGLTLGEALWQSVAAPYQVIMIGDPLACPFKEDRPAIELIRAEPDAEGLQLKIRADPGPADRRLAWMTCAIDEGPTRAVYPQPRTDTEVVVGLSEGGGRHEFVARLARDESPSAAWKRLAAAINADPAGSVRATATKKVLVVESVMGAPMRPVVSVRCRAPDGSVPGWIPHESKGRFEDHQAPRPASAVLWLRGTAKRDDDASLVVGGVRRTVAVAKGTDAAALAAALCKAFEDVERFSMNDGLALSASQDNDNWTRLRVKSKRPGPEWNATDVRLDIGRDLGIGFAPYERAVKMLDGAEATAGRFGVRLTPNPITSTKPVGLTLGNITVRLEPLEGWPLSDFVPAWRQPVDDARPDIGVTTDKDRLILRTRAAEPPFIAIANADNGLGLEFLGGRWERLPSFEDDKKDVEGGPADWIAFLGLRAGVAGISEHTVRIGLDRLAPGEHRLALMAFFTGAYPVEAHLETDFVLLSIPKTSSGVIGGQVTGNAEVIGGDR